MALAISDEDCGTVHIFVAVVWSREDRDDGSRLVIPVPSVLFVAFGLLFMGPNQGFETFFLEEFIDRVFAKHHRKAPNFVEGVFCAVVIIFCGICPEQIREEALLVRGLSFAVNIVDCR